MTPLRLKKGLEENIRKGFPWVYAGDIIDSSELALLPAGALVSIETMKGERIGVGYYNAKSQIACRVLALGNEKIDEVFFKKRIAAALALREKIIGVPYYRLVHSESDYLPGLLIDRFGDALVLQVGTAGMEALLPLIIAALEKLLSPKTIVLRNDTGARKLEGLAQEVKILPSPPVGEGGVGGNFPRTQSLNMLHQPPLPNPPPQGGRGYMVRLEENECIYLADLINGQKTGWFYDQRDNRKMIAECAHGKTLIDIYSHSGGFGLLAAKAGAKVTLVDSSALALEIAGKAAALNKVDIESIKGDAFAVMEKLAKENKIFDIVLADPPAFVKTKKDIASGLKGYEKVTKLAAPLVASGGLLFVASCSHHAGRSAFNKAVLDGVKKAGSRAEIVKQTGASADHPRHPMLAQNEYLKGLLLRIIG